MAEITQIRWVYLFYTSGRPYDGYAHGSSEGKPITCPIRHKNMDRYTGATVIEARPVDEETLLDDLCDLMLRPGMNSPQTTAADALPVQVEFYRERGARIGHVTEDGSIVWEGAA